MAMVRRATGPSLSPAVVATGLGRARPGEEHCADDLYERVRANGPVFVKKKLLNMCVHNVYFIGLKHGGLFKFNLTCPT